MSLVSFLANPCRELQKHILPTLAYSRRKVLWLEAKASSLFEGCIKRRAFQAKDTMRLDQVHFSRDFDTPDSKKKYVVYFLPNGMLWQESSDKIKELQQIFSADVVCTNYRGCGKSQGTPKSDTLLVQDGVAQVKALLQKGVLVSNIVLYGYSLGGGVAICTAGELEKEGHSLRVVNERSFRTIPSVIRNFEALTDVPIVGGVAAKLAACFVKRFGWSLAAEKCLSALKERVIVIYNDADDVIDSTASLKQAVKEQGTPSTVTLLSMDLAHESGHNRVWTKAETARFSRALAAIW